MAKRRPEGGGRTGPVRIVTVTDRQVRCVPCVQRSQPHRGTRRAIRRTGVALAILGSLVTGCAEEPTFQGTALDPPRKTLDFTLRDQFGQRIHLADLRGRVVVLTFLYTSCPDLCPLLTAKLRTSVESLADLAPRVAFLAVTVDPERDTMERVRAYSAQHGMLHRWHFLIGRSEDLRPIWEYYWVGKVWKTEKGDVMHQAPVHLIDGEGQVRVVYGSTFRPADLAHDIRALGIRQSSDFGELSRAVVGRRSTGVP
ncbi:MAG: SCO family protein [Candidatus Methylomirabilales bacterium]